MIHLICLLAAATCWSRQLPVGQNPKAIQRTPVRAIELTFTVIQSAPDLLQRHYRHGSLTVLKTRAFSFSKGDLPSPGAADEIKPRTGHRCKSALLEPAERVSIGRETIICQNCLWSWPPRIPIEAERHLSPPEGTVWTAF